MSDTQAQFLNTRLPPGKQKACKTCQLQRQTGNEKSFVIFKDILVLKYSFAVDGSNSQFGPLKQILSVDY